MDKNNRALQIIQKLIEDEAALVRHYNLNLKCAESNVKLLLEIKTMIKDRYIDCNDGFFEQLDLINK
jgi:hypothetical protein